MQEPAHGARPNLRTRFRRAFFAGLAALLPTILTIGVLVFCWNVLNLHVAQRVTHGLQAILKTELAADWYWRPIVGLTDAELAEEPPPGAPTEGFVPFGSRADAHVPPWLGIVIAVLLVTVVGFLLKGYVGRQVVHLVEGSLQHIPIIRIIFPYAKQITQFFFEGRRPIQYRNPVAIEYPRKGIYSIGFVTTDGFAELTSATGRPMVSVFLPSSPTPVTGYVVVVPKEEVITLQLTIDEALSYIVTGGVILPAEQLSGPPPSNAAPDAPASPQAGRLAGPPGAG